jgi:hypothetical protein
MGLLSKPQTQLQTAATEVYPNGESVMDVEAITPDTIPVQLAGRVVARAPVRGRVRATPNSITGTSGASTATTAATDGVSLREVINASSSRPANRVVLPNAGFEELTGDSPRRIFAQLQAQEKCGKTHFCCTMPGPIAAITTDTGTEEVARKFQRKGKKFYIKHIDVPREEKGTRLGQNTDKYEKFWWDVEDAVDWVLNNRSIKSMFIDTITELWEIFRLARFGKLTQVNPQHYGPVNREFSDWLKRIYRTRPDLNVIFISKVKKEYKAMKTKEETAWNGKWERAGFGDLAYIARMNIEAYYERTISERDPVTGADVIVQDGRFAMHVLDCGENADVIGLRMYQPELDFATLAVNVFPDSDFPEWE